MSHSETQGSQREDCKDVGYLDGVKWRGIPWGGRHFEETGGLALSEGDSFQKGLAGYLFELTSEGSEA